MNFNFLKYSNLYFIFTGVLTAAGIASVLVFGLNLGIEFTGGSILEVEYKEIRPSENAVKTKLADLNLGEFFLQPSNEKGLILRMKELSEETHQQVLAKLREQSELQERRFESIGPVIGRELRGKTIILISLSLFSIVLYVAFSFRKLSQPLKSWQYGLASLVSLFHDVLIPLAVFAVLGKIGGIQITVPVIVALLIVLGYSINNTVVVFDRIRENVLKRRGIDYRDIVNKSLNQTFTRCLNTSLTTLFALAAIYFFGGETLRYFALALILGIVAGTYSSIFLAGPLLVAWQKLRKTA